MGWIGWVDDLEALQRSNCRQACIGRHKDQFVWQPTCGGDGTGELNGIEASQWIWPHLPILGAETRRHRQDSWRDGDEEVDRKGAARSLKAR
jgi:hypothetical protein